MYLQIRHLLLVLLTSFLLFASCDEYAFGPEIEWVAGSEMLTYNYSGGVVSGATIYKRFNVVGEDSGEIKIEAKCGTTKKTCTEFVEGGEQYRVVITCGLGKKNSQSTITLDSPSVSEPFKITITGYSLNMQGIDIR